MTAKLDSQITVALDRGFYDAKEVEHLFTDLDVFSVDKEMCDEFIASTVDRMYVDGMKVMNVLLDIRNKLNLITGGEDGVNDEC